MSDSHGETKHEDTSYEQANPGKSPRRTLLVTLGMLALAALAFIPPLLTRTAGDFFIAVWTTIVLIGVFSSMILVKRLMEAERSRDHDLKQAETPISH